MQHLLDLKKAKGALLTRGFLALLLAASVTTLNAESTLPKVPAPMPSQTQEETEVSSVNQAGVNVAADSQQPKDVKSSVAPKLQAPATGRKDPTVPDGLIEMILSPRKKKPNAPKAINTSGELESGAALPPPQAPEVTLKARMLMKGKAPVAMLMAEGKVYTVREGSAFVVSRTHGDGKVIFRYDIKRIDENGILMHLSSIDEDSVVDLR